MTDQHEPPLSEAELLELEQAEKAATEGPWTTYKCGYWDDLTAEVHTKHGSILLRLTDHGDKQANANLIALSRNLLPRLLADLKRLKREQKILLDTDPFVQLEKVCDERDELEKELKRARAEVDQLHVQLAGCGVAALGWDKGECKQGDYGWSASFGDVVKLRARLNVAEAFVSAECWQAYEEALARAAWREQPEAEGKGE